LTQVRRSQDIAKRFNAGPNSAIEVGHRITQYLQNAVNLSRALKDDKTGFFPLKKAGKPWESFVPDELVTFEKIIGNFEATSDHERWMFAKREAHLSPVGSRELWLILGGNTTWEEWSEDAKPFVRPADIGLDSAGICTGFYNKAQRIVEDMVSQMAMEAVRREARVPFHRIFIVGFGIGGAVATIFQSLTAVPVSSPGMHMTQSAQDAFLKLQQIWKTALGVNVFNTITINNVHRHFLTFALEPAPAFKSKRGPEYWETDAYALQTDDSFVKRILEKTLVLTVYGEDPLPRLNIEVAGGALPPVKVGIFYSASRTRDLPKKYLVDENTFYFMDGPLVDNAVARFLTWFGVCGATLRSRITQAANVMQVLDAPTVALRQSGVQFDDGQVAAFSPEVFVKGIQELERTSSLDRQRTGIF